MILGSCLLCLLRGIIQQAVKARLYVASFQRFDGLGPPLITLSFSGVSIQGKSCLFFFSYRGSSELEMLLLSIRDGQCPEYTGEDQAICAVGLTKCRPGVFVEAIQYLLVLATPAEVKLFSFRSLVFLFFFVYNFFLCFFISWCLLEFAALKDLMVEIHTLKFQYSLFLTIQYHPME